MKQVRSRRENFILIVTLGILNALTPFTIDMYLPSFPNIAADLNVPVEKLALTVSLYFIGYAFGQLFYGPLLDRFGRKPPIYFGLGLYAAATVGIIYSTSFNELLLYRLLSALGGCAASVGAIAMVRDYFPPAAGAKVFSMMMLVLSASPLFAPTIGSFVISIASWRAIFGVLAAFCFLDILLVAFALPKGYEPDRSVVLRLKPILSGFRSVLKNKQFATYTLAGSFSFAGLFVYIAGSPAIFMEGFKVSAQIYGVIFATLAVGMIGGGQLNLLLAKRLSGRTIFKYAIIMEVFFGLTFLTGTIFGVFGLTGTVAMLFFILLSAGISYPNAASLALEPFTKNIGSASAMLGCLQLGIGALTSAGVGLLEIKGSLPTAAVICISAVIALSILLFAERHRVAS